MSAVENGQLLQLSASQLDAFDPTQPGGCERRWWFDRAAGLRPEQTDQQSEGDAGHALLATYFRTGEKPKGRVKMGKAVMGAIVKGDLPSPGPDLWVERRFDGGAMRDANGNWVDLNVAKTLVVAGVPFDGAIDLVSFRGELPEIIDHKFSSDIHVYSKTPSQLLLTNQMPLYALAVARLWHDGDVKLTHHYVSKRGVDSKLVSVVAGLDDLAEARVRIEKLVGRIRLTAGAQNQDDVPANLAKDGAGKLKACDAFNGCPHRGVCSAYRRRGIVNLSPDELAAFDALDAMAASVPSPSVTPTPPEKPKRLHIAVDPREGYGTCQGCGTTLSAETASRLRDGRVLHINCPTPVVHTLPPDAPPSNPALAAQVPEAPKQSALFVDVSPARPTPSSAPTPPSAPTLETPVRVPLTPEQARAVGVSEVTLVRDDVTAVAPVVIQFELGPKTLEALAALLRR